MLQKKKKFCFFFSQFRWKCNVTHWDPKLALLRVTELSDGFCKLVWLKKKKQTRTPRVGFPFLCCDFKTPLFWFTYMTNNVANVVKCVSLCWETDLCFVLSVWDKSNAFIFKMNKSVKLRSSCLNFIVYTLSVFHSWLQLAGSHDVLLSSQYLASRVASLCDITKGNISTLFHGKDQSTQKMSSEGRLWFRWSSFDDSPHPQRTIGTVDFKVLFYRENTRQK